MSCRNRPKTLMSILLLSLVFCCALAKDTSASPPGKRILILFPYECNMPGFVAMDKGFRSTLTSSKDYEFEFYMECMDLTRFPDERYHDKLMDLYREKYAATPIDLIVADLRPSLKFLESFRPESIKDVPVIFLEQDLRMLGEPTPLPVTTVVAGGLDLEGTLATAMRLHPDARSVYVVTGASHFDQSLYHMAREALRNFEDKVVIQHLCGIPLDDLIHRISSLPEQSLVLYISIFQDGTGKAFQSPEALALISKQANAPIYGVSESYIGKGIVGGNLTSHFDQGVILARVALRVLEGKSPGVVGPPEAQAGKYIFDARELERWKISRGSAASRQRNSFRELFRMGSIPVAGSSEFLPS